MFATSARDNSLVSHAANFPVKTCDKKLPRRRLSPELLPESYLLRMASGYTCGLERLHGPLHDLPDTEGPQYALRLFHFVRAKYMTALREQIYGATGIALSIAGLIVSYNDTDPVCEYCHQTVDHRCSTKNCDNGVHYRGGGCDVTLPCSRTIPLAVWAQTKDEEKDSAASNVASEDEAKSEPKPTTQCISCFTQERVCYMCDEPYHHDDTLRCEYPGCKSVAHNHCTELDDNWQRWTANEDGDESYFCELHDVESADAPRISRCLQCEKYEPADAEVTGQTPALATSGGEFATCVICRETFHVDCIPFFKSCIPCQEASIMCSHPTTAGLVCECCYDEVVTCGICEDGVVGYPGTNDIMHCDSCDMSFHTNCGAPRTELLNGVNHTRCSDCWSRRPATDEENETLARDSERRNILRSKQLHRALPLEKEVMDKLAQYPIFASHLVTGLPTLADLLPRLTEILFYRIYVDWGRFDAEAKVLHGEAVTAAGAALPSRHSDSDVKYLIHAYMGHWDILRPWEDRIPVAIWRENFGL